MKWIVAAAGLLMAAFGAYWGFTGSLIVQVERGWSAVIGGSVLFAAGMLMLALAALIGAVNRLARMGALAPGKARPAPPVPAAASTFSQEPPLSPEFSSAAHTAATDPAPAPVLEDRSQLKLDLEAEKAPAEAQATIPDARSPEATLADDAKAGATDVADAEAHPTAAAEPVPAPERAAPSAARRAARPERPVAPPPVQASRSAPAEPMAPMADQSLQPVPQAAPRIEVRPERQSELAAEPQAVRLQSKPTATARPVVPPPPPVPGRARFNRSPGVMTPPPRPVAPQRAPSPPVPPPPSAPSAATPSAPPPAPPAASPPESGPAEASVGWLERALRGETEAPAKSTQAQEAQTQEAQVQEAQADAQPFADALDGAVQQEV
ncbi:MAG: hypothetical protein K2Y29_17745, partial [Beijerinckiaceae bacterium]|nr:hypothetical protein [Beijerinckiaceae bacterium]